MLTSLHIRNLAVVAATDVEFADGLTVMTGETGAGKSILVDALALALGARGEARLVRDGAARAEISAVFDAAALPGSARHWLTEQSLDIDDHCVVRRVVTAEGRSRGFINDQPVSMQSLRELGEQLLDLCGQQAHLQLRHAAAQRELLDQYGGHTQLVDAMQRAFREWRQARDALATHDEAQRNGKQRAELLGFQVQELEALDLQPGEYAELEQLHRILGASQRIEAGLREALFALYEADDGAAQQVLGRTARALVDLAETDPGIEAAARMTEEASVLASEAAAALRERLAALEHDPAQEAQVSQRIADARTLARKHRVEPDELPAIQRQLAAELDSLTGGEFRRTELAEALAASEAALQQAADGLTQARRKAATRLGKQVTEYMRALGMPGGSFGVELEARDDGDITRHGAESISFTVTTNPGQPGGPLARIASGGELSRISLALQVAARQQAGAATLVFDEVDTGVGGRVAEMVGQQLHTLAQRSQVLCVTHLPQVASQGDHHFRVVKATAGGETTTAVVPLEPAARVEELARMLGGMKITQRTRDHAKEMLAAAELREAG